MGCVLRDPNFYFSEGPNVRGGGPSLKRVQHYIGWSGVCQISHHFGYPNQRSYPGFRTAEMQDFFHAGMASGGARNKLLSDGGATTSLKI